MKKMGRPKAANPKSFQLGVSFDAELATELQLYCDAHSISKAEAVRRGVKLLMQSDNGVSEAEKVVSDPKKPENPTFRTEKEKKPGKH